ncbi:hypothetical protein EGY25_03830 [Brevundimonas intermedia]|uniref:Uncharacterized protein n=1 Tax=Brevundimonas intermedia TaxID=74315 RepID=A0A4Y9S2P3_9CAUL|nr:hypothetical protein [Brevundimonas intermedia]TFW14336.1 hypothetical protein EGY25_03830 [Brevundimonas intermedia]
MSNEVYSKDVVDKMLQGIMLVQSHTMRLIVEERIADERNSRAEMADLMDQLKATSENPVVDGFYAAMSRAVRAGDTDEVIVPVVNFRVIEGGKSD